MVPFNLEPQHGAFKEKIICTFLFLWSLEAPKKHARSYKYATQYMKSEF